jgi:hypothetical protein
LLAMLSNVMFEFGDMVVKTFLMEKQRSEQAK